MKDLATALDEARRRERLSHAEWRRRRAQVARLIAAGEETAAEALVDRIDPPTDPRLPCRVERAAPDLSAPRTTRPSIANRPARHVAGRRPTAANPTGATLRSRRRPQGRRRGLRAWLRKRRAWVASLALHALMALILGLITFGSRGAPGLLLVATIADEADSSETPVEMVLPALNASLATPPAIELPTTEYVVEPPTLTPTIPVGDLLAIDSAALMAEVPGPVGATERSPGTNAPEETSAPTAGSVRFFGAEAVSECVVFVVDNSGSMKQGRLETTLAQLDRTVRGLSHSQRFYVVFFSDQAYPMFFPESIDEAIPASPDNKKRLTAWLHTVEMCLGGRVIDAMDLARGLEPDTVFLLSDGDIRSEFVAARLTEPGAWPFVINTLGMGVRTPRQVELLRAIASRTGGQFHRVGAEPAAARRALTRPIRYHRAPGPVWGSQVKAWK